MNDPFIEPEVSFISLYRKMVVPVFRYHLVRSGDWQEAQALTRETFLHAQAWFKPGITDPTEIKFWLFSIAVWVQLYKRRSVEIDNSILPTQVQVAQFVRVGEVTQAWNVLPLRTADALALFMFGGLELAEAGEVVNWDLPTIQERLYVHLEDQVNLRLLADELQPVGYFIGRLETELREDRTQTNRGAGPFFWRLAYRFNRAMGLSGRVLPLVFFLVLLFWAIWYFSLPLQPSRFVRPTATSQPTAQPQDFPPTLNSAILVDRPGAVIQDYLVSQEKIQLTPAGHVESTYDVPGSPMILGIHP
jgi:DNA-directed RNA polymerase specialized sigma24 family protein